MPGVRVLAMSSSCGAEDHFRNSCKIRQVVDRGFLIRRVSAEECGCSWQPAHLLLALVQIYRELAGGR
jgi:hypothetical protein